MKNWPKLFKKSSTGALLEWEIEVEEGRDNGVIVTRHGQVGGAIQEGRDVVREGKNVGRKNATSAYEQACMEAESKWEKQVSRKGYVGDIARAEAGKTDQAGFVSPMLAHKWSERGAKYGKFPGFAQFKYDGIRILGVVQGGKASLWSRERKPIIGLPHIVGALQELSLSAKRPDFVLDGEAYNHAYRDKFEEIASFVKQQKAPKPGYEAVEYHVYDYPSCPGGFAERSAALRALGMEYIGYTKYLIPAPTTLVHSEDELMEFFRGAREHGFEGAMYRHAEGEYEDGKRSSYLLKIKEFQDADFSILSVREGRGKMEGRAIFLCAAENGKTFDCKMRGPLDLLGEIFRDESLWHGKKLVVEYQNLTADGVPRFPIGVRIREPGL